jgi:hypothetical protein
MLSLSLPEQPGTAQTLAPQTKKAFCQPGSIVGAIRQSSLEHEQGRLDRRPLALASEVGAKTGAQVAGPADVEHTVSAAGGNQ